MVGDTEFEIDGRGEEVLAWLKSEVAHDVCGFVVLDDNYASQFEQSLPGGHFVETFLDKGDHPDRKSDSDFDPENEGLTAVKAELAYQCLMKPYNQTDLK